MTVPFYIGEENELESALKVFRGSRLKKSFRVPAFPQWFIRKSESLKSVNVASETLPPPETPAALPEAVTWSPRRDGPRREGAKAWRGSMGEMHMSHERIRADGEGALSVQTKGFLSRRA